MCCIMTRSRTHSFGVWIVIIRVLIVLIKSISNAHRFFLLFRSYVVDISALSGDAHILDRPVNLRTEVVVAWAD